MPKTLSDRVTAIETELPLKYDLFEKEFKALKSQVKSVKEDVKSYHSDVKNGMSDRIAEKVANKMLEKKQTNGKGRMKKFWENDNFWKLANRGMVIILFMIFILLAGAFGIDISGEESIIRKLLFAR